MNGYLRQIHALKFVSRQCPKLEYKHHSKNKMNRGLIDPVNNALYLLITMQQTELKLYEIKIKASVSCDNYAVDKIYNNSKITFTMGYEVNMVCG